MDDVQALLLCIQCRFVLPASHPFRKGIGAVCSSSRFIHFHGFKRLYSEFLGDVVRIEIAAGVCNESDLIAYFTFAANQKIGVAGCLIHDDISFEKWNGKLLFYIRSGGLTPPHLLSFIHHNHRCRRHRNHHDPYCKILYQPRCAYHGFLLPF